MKIEDEKILLMKKKFYKSLVKAHKNDFSKIIKKLQVQNKQSKNFSVYAIAAKIARGETVTPEELQYIKENAPSLYESAVRQNEERVENERGGKDLSKEVKQINSINGYGEDTIKAENKSTKIGDDKPSPQLSDRNVKIGF